MSENKQSNPFFKLEDLQSLEFTIEATNSTSRVSILKGGIRLIQIMEDGIWIEIPPRSCNVGHMLALQIIARKLTGESAQENRIQVTGVVEEIEGDPKAPQQVKLRFRQYGREQWETLLKYFTEKQFSVNQLIKNTRK